MTRETIVDPDTEFRQLASEWHGGQWSPLYAYASTGSVIHGLCSEIRSCIRTPESACGRDPDASVLADFRRSKDRLERFLGHVAPIEDQLPEEPHAPDCKCSNCYIPRV